MTERQHPSRHAGRQMPAAVLWDMDGTLVDTEPYWFEVERQLVESFGGDWPDHHAKAMVGFDLLDSAEYIRRHSPVTMEPVEIVEHLLDGMLARVRERIPWRPGARRLLDELNEAGIPCALVTMSWRRFVDPIVAALPPGTFTAVITGDEVPEGAGKPHPYPYQIAAKACGVDPRHCVAIEDSPTGVKSAVAAGCRVLGVPNARSIRPGHNVTVIDSLADITPPDLADLDRLVRTEIERRPGPDRRLLVFGSLAAVAVMLALILVLRGGDGNQAEQLPPGAIPIDVWAPYWTLADTLSEVDQRLHQTREVSPFWFGARSATSIVTDENSPSTATAEFLQHVRSSSARLVPSIRDEMTAGGMAAVLADETTRDQHIETILGFADDLDADGIDLDYEQFAFADGSSTWEATRPNWVTFIEDLAEALHDDGRTLTVSIPAVYDEEATGDRGYWVYDHGAIAEHVDKLRIMAYDFSVAEPGPIAPLDWVAQAVDGVSKAVPEEYHDKLVLGVPAYGANWITSTAGTCPATAEGRTNVTARSVLDLAALRQATPVYDPSVGEWSFTYELPVTDGATSCVQSRVVRWVDAEGAGARAEIARRAGWGGVALWALGYEDEAVWAAMITATRSVIPAEAPAD